MNRIFAIDPSSTRCGWALMQDDGIIAAGLVKPQAKRCTTFERCCDLADQLFDTAFSAVNMTRNPSEIATLTTCIVIEIPSGRVNRSRHTGGGHGLSVMGMAVGIIAQRMREIAKSHPATTLCVVTEAWTGSHSKAKRARVALREFSAYAAVQESDRGNDISDAIALAVWFRDIGAKKEIATA